MTRPGYFAHLCSEVYRNVVCVFEYSNTVLLYIHGHSRWWAVAPQIREKIFLGKHCNIRIIFSWYILPFDATIAFLTHKIWKHVACVISYYRQRFDIYYWFGFSGLKHVQSPNCTLEIYFQLLYDVKSSFFSSKFVIRLTLSAGLSLCLCVCLYQAYTHAHRHNL